MAAKRLSGVSFTATLVMLLLLPTAIGKAKADKIDYCNGVASNLNYRVHEACRDLGLTSMCSGYCSKDSGNACDGKCVNKRCKCFPDCGGMDSHFLVTIVPENLPMPLCGFGNTSAVCNVFCKEESEYNCHGRCSDVFSDCKCFKPE